MRSITKYDLVLFKWAGDPAFGVVLDVVDSEKYGTIVRVKHGPWFIRGHWLYCEEKHFEVIGRSLLGRLIDRFGTRAV